MKRQAFELCVDGAQAIQLLSVGATVLPLLLHEYPELAPWLKNNGWPLPVGILPEEDGEDSELFSLAFGEGEAPLLEEAANKFPEEMERFLALCFFRLRWGNA